MRLKQVPVAHSPKFFAFLVTMSLWFLGCEADDPDPDGPSASAGNEATAGDTESMNSAGTNAAANELRQANVACTEPVNIGSSANDCGPNADDYPGAAWPDCIADDGQWHLTGSNAESGNPPSSQARIASFETMSNLLVCGEGIPSSEAFLDARMEYAIDNGLDSRVQRRYDAHLERPEDDINCRGEDHGERFPEYCIGPGRILPSLTSAFIDGSEGQEPMSSAARVEAGLLWFFYVSTYKEAYSCKSTAKDCDSAWAYYGAGQTADAPAVGLAKYVQRIDTYSHTRVFDALLAIRCWRDLDSAEESEDENMHNRALAQLDTALDHALAVILINRVERVLDADGATDSADWAFLGILGPVIDRAARTIDPERADQLLALWDSGTREAGITIVSLLEGLFPCP